MRALYEGKPLARLTENTISDLDALIEQLEQVRLKGYAYEQPANKKSSSKMDLEEEKYADSG